MKTLITMVFLFTSSPVMAMTDAECENAGWKATKATEQYLGEDGCNAVSAYSSLVDSKVEHGKCNFTLVYGQAGTQVQCIGKRIPSPGYRIRKPIALLKFRRACINAGFSQTLYVKSQGQRRVECQE